MNVSLRELWNGLRCFVGSHPAPSLREVKLYTRAGELYCIYERCTLCECQVNHVWFTVDTTEPAPFEGMTAKDLDRLRQHFEDR